MNEHTELAQSYCPLADNSIRLLEILPGHPPSELHCELREVTLDSEPKYIALSYAWGNPPAQHNIWLNGRLLKVRKNLWRFLSQASTMRDIIEGLF